jgi:hypothetical protein
MKYIYFFFAAVMATTAMDAQIIFESNFENWTDPNTPEGWWGTRTNYQIDSVTQSTNGATFGSFLMNLRNEQGSHRRMTTQPLSMTEGQPYEVEVWVKGQGELRVGLYDGDLDGFDFGFNYNPYEDIDGDDVISFVQVVEPDTTSDEMEVILSLLDGIVEIDRVEVRLGEAQQPEARTIQEIQMTMDPDGDSPELGNLIITSGVVTATADNGYWIQDGTGPWSGIYVNDGLNSPSRGDEVEVTATVGEFFDKTNLTDIDAFTNLGSAGVPSAESLGTAAADDEQWEGVLVTTIAACIVDLDGFNEWFIDDDSGPIAVNDFMYFFDPEVGTVYEVTGILDYSFGAFKIEPRDEEDVDIFSSVQELVFGQVSIFPNPANDVLNIQAEITERTQVKILDMTGRVLIEEVMLRDVQRIALAGLESGRYFLELSTDEARAYHSFVKH